MSAERIRRPQSPFSWHESAVDPDGIERRSMRWRQVLELRNMAGVGEYRTKSYDKSESVLIGDDVNDSQSALNRMYFIPTDTEEFKELKEFLPRIIVDLRDVDLQDRYEIIESIGADTYTGFSEDVINLLKQFLKRNNAVQAIYIADQLDVEILESLPRHNESPLLEGASMNSSKRRDERFFQEILALWIAESDSSHLFDESRPAQNFSASSLLAMSR